MSCNCYTIPLNAIFSQSVTVVTVDGTDTLVIDLPERAYNDGFCFNIFVIDPIPAGATVNMPVAFSIGGDTETVYPFIGCCGNQVTACGITTRTRYPVQVVTSATSGVFRSLRKIQCYPTNALASLPVATAAALSTSATTPVATAAAIPSKTTKTVTTTKKEVVSHE